MYPQRVKPSKVTDDMGMDEWFFLSGVPVYSLDEIGSNVRHVGCSETAAPIHVNTRGVNGPEIVQRTLDAMPALVPIEVRAHTVPHSHGYDCECPRCADCLPTECVYELPRWLWAWIWRIW